jgi:hypothetical protein
MSPVKAKRARENRAYVRVLLRERQPAFAAALAYAEQYLVFRLGRRKNRDDDPALAGQDRAAPRRSLAEVGRQARGIRRARIVFLAAQCLQRKIAGHFSVCPTAVITLGTRRAEVGLPALVDRPKGFG